MKNFQITKKLFQLTSLLLVINILLFLYDKGIGFNTLIYAVVFYFPVLLLAILFDRFYLKNKGYYFLATIVLVGVITCVAYLLFQIAVSSVFFLL